MTSFKTRRSETFSIEIFYEWYKLFSAKTAALKTLKRNRNTQEMSSDSDHEKVEKSSSGKTADGGKKRKAHVAKKAPARISNGTERSKGPLADVASGERGET